MVAVKYIVRLLRTTFFQFPQRFRAPTDPQDLSQKVFVVTGGNTGIGLETVKELARRGATVIIGSRSIDKAEKARTLLQQESGNSLKLHIVQLDLGDLASVKNFASEVQALLDHRNIDALVNNAGVWTQKYETSKQGHEVHFATNHLGPFLLTQLLLPNMASPGGRVVFVNAELHTLATDATPDFTYTWTGHNAITPAYARSKLANVWYAYELQRRQPQLVVPVLHPGVIFSSLVVPPSRIQQWAMAKLFISTKQGAQTTLFCTLADGVNGLTYYHNCLGVVPSSELSYSQEKATKMWDLSIKLTQGYL